jgi:hypothetical protein
MPVGATTKTAICCFNYSSFFCPEPVLANDHFSEGRLKTRPCVRTVVDRISEHERRRHVMRRAGLARMWLEREGV